jgi:hypothetical protein
MGLLRMINGKSGADQGGHPETSGAAASAASKN